MGHGRLANHDYCEEVELKLIEGKNTGSRNMYIDEGRCRVWVIPSAKNFHDCTQHAQPLRETDVYGLPKSRDPALVSGKSSPMLGAANK